ncbi:MAG: hypothetical protein ABR987_17030 [Terracidiphilus sp.]
MNEPLHPSSLSEILDRTAQIYRSRFLVFLGIAIIPTAVLVAFAGCGVLAFVLTGLNTATPVAGLAAVLAFAALGMVVLPIFIAVTALATAAMSHAAARLFLGQAVTIRDSYKAVWRRGWQYIGVWFLQIAAVWIVPIAAWIAAIFSSTLFGALAGRAGMGVNGGIVAFFMFIVVAGLVTYGVWMNLRLSLAFPACVVEQIGPWNALRRTSALSQGTKGRILLLYLLGAALNWIVTIAVWLPVTIVIAIVVGSGNPQRAEAVGTLAGFAIYGVSFAVQALTRPVYGIALVLFYYDQRIRQEAFDIEWMMLQAGLVVPLPTQPSEPSTAAIGEPI